MNRRFGVVTCVLTFVIVATLSNEASAVSRNSQVQRAKRADLAPMAGDHRASARRKSKRATRVTGERRKPARPIVVLVPSMTASPLSADLTAVKQAMDLVRRGKLGEATDAQKSIDDQVHRKLVEWFLLRYLAQT
jgi:soluble lytic murein transglycosylase